MGFGDGKNPPEWQGHERSVPQSPMSSLSICKYLQRGDTIQPTDNSNNRRSEKSASQTNVGIIAFDYRGKNLEKQENPGRKGSSQSSSLTPLRGNNRVHRENSHVLIWVEKYNDIVEVETVIIFLESSWIGGINNVYLNK